MSSAIKDVFPLGFPWQTPDPFLFCVHHLDHYPVGAPTLGVKAAELKGRRIGSDFSGRDGVQWMTAGSGVVHSEMFPLLDQKNKNTVELFQIWLNLPKADKMVDPYFTMLWREDIPVITVKDENQRESVVTLVAGHFQNRKALSPPPNSWAKREHAQVHVYTIEMQEGAELTLPAVDKECSRYVYFYEGEALNIDAFSIGSGHGVSLFGEHEVTLRATGACKLLVLGGMPIGEPVAQYGPFVMNTRAEIEEAFADYRRTQFGGWSWPKNGPVHGKVARRFAKHADGKVENKEA